MSPFYKSQVIHSIFLSLSYMHIYIYISPHSRINKHKFTHAIFLLSLSYFLSLFDALSLSVQSKRGNKRIFIRISFSLKPLWKFPSIWIGRETARGKEDRKDFRFTGIKFTKDDPELSCFVFVAVIAIDWNESCVEPNLSSLKFLHSSI